jgi:hypothetical protein
MRRNIDDAIRWRIHGTGLLLVGLVAFQGPAFPAGASAGQAAVMADVAPDSLRLRVEAPDSVPVGRDVATRFIVDNVSGRALNLYLLGRTIAFDVIVRDPDGDVVWRRMDGEVVPQILRVEMLPAGGSLVLEATWDQRSNDGDPVATGTYSVEAELFTDGEPLRSPPVNVRIVDR